MHHSYAASLLYKIDEYQSDHVIYTIIKEMMHILEYWMKKKKQILTIYEIVLTILWAR